MKVEAQRDVVSEIDRLRDEITRAAAATETALGGQSEGSEDENRGAPPAEQAELYRQLGALRERVATAERANGDPGALRAELATLLFFARTLEADAHEWRSSLEGRIDELERQRAAARRERERMAAERERLVAERETLARRRDGLQLSIVQTAARMVQRDGGEWRRTLPVFTLDEGLTVCSVAVSCPRRGLRFPRQWLVTLNRTRDDVTIRRE